MKMEIKSGTFVITALTFRTVIKRTWMATALEMPVTMTQMEMVGLAKRDHITFKSRL